MFIAISKKKENIGQLMAVGESETEVARILFAMGLNPLDFNIIDPEVEGKRIMNEYY